MHDIEGNVLKVDDVVYINDAARVGSRHKRLLRGKVLEINGRTAKVEVFENGRTYSKTGKSIVKPQQ